MGTYTIPIRHYSDKAFLDAFLQDVATSARSVLILSPFLSPNRALHYYPAMMSLYVRNVSIDVFVRPRSGQPESLRNRFDNVVHRMERMGAHVHLQQEMHEKVAVIDGEILWHGSLNILSHNNTRESMLRFESRELVRDVVDSLRLEPTEVTAAHSALPTADQQENGIACPVCRRSMIYFGNQGLWICSASPTCSGIVPVESPANEPNSRRQPQVLPIKCPLCTSNLVAVGNVITHVRCDNGNCLFELDRRIAHSILRILHGQASK